jgi:hypothetical protein
MEFVAKLEIVQSEKVARIWAAIGRRQSPPIIDGNRFEYFRISPVLLRPFGASEKITNDQLQMTN